MNQQQLYREIGMVDGDLIAEADTAAQERSRHKPWIRWTAVAACLCLCALGVWVWQNKESNPPQQGGGSLPMLSIDDTFISGTMGFEGYVAYDVSDLTGATPWTETNTPATLPVFKNAVVSGIDTEAMIKRLREVAALLGVEQSTIDDAIVIGPTAEEREKVAEKFAATGEDVPSDYFNTSGVSLETDGFKIEVDASLETTIHFEPTVALPAEYNFTHYASYEEKYAVAQYLQIEYAALLAQMGDPRIALSGGDYSILTDGVIVGDDSDSGDDSIDSRQSYDINFYNAAGTIESQIVNYCFNRISFYCNDDGKLFLIRIRQPDLSHKLGDYPIISAEQARQLLCDGYYLTTVPEDFTGEEYIRKVELLYRNDNSKTNIPYYRFLVELPDMERDNGLKTYGAYYVPAVDGKYIENMEVWEGSFN